MASDFLLFNMSVSNVRKLNILIKKTAIDTISNREKTVNFYCSLCINSSTSKSHIIRPQTLFRPIRGFGFSTISTNYKSKFGENRSGRIDSQSTVVYKK
jgi:hypothetical protein